MEEWLAKNVRPPGEAVEKELEEWKTTFDAITDLVSIHDQNFRLIKGNKAFMDILGMKSENFVGRKCHEILHSTKTPSPHCPHRKAMESGKPVTEEFWEPRLDRYLQVSASPVFNKKGKPIGSIHIARDLTDRKKVEEALRKSEEEARRMAKEASVIAQIGRVISSTLNIDEVYESFSEIVQSLIPYDRIVVSLILDPATLINRCVRGDFVPGRNEGDRFPMAGSLTEVAIQNRKGLIFECNDAKQMATLYPLVPEITAGFRSFLSVPLFSRNQPIGGLHFRSQRAQAYSQEDLKIAQMIADQVGGAIASAKLFSDLRSAETTLKKSEQQYRLLAENMSDVIWTLDLNLRVTYVSPSVQQLRGYTPEEVMAEDLENILSPSSLKVALEAFSEELAIKRTTPGDPQRSRTLFLEFTCKNKGAIWAESKITSIRDAEGRISGFLGVTRDISERKRLEEEKIRSENLQTRLAMAATVNHELHQPMQVIYGYVGFLLSQSSKHEPIYKTLTIIKKEVERMKEITNELKKPGEVETRDYIGISRIFDIHQTRKKTKE